MTNQMQQLHMRPFEQEIYDELVAIYSALASGEDRESLRKIAQRMYSQHSGKTAILPEKLAKAITPLVDVAYPQAARGPFLPADAQRVLNELQS